MERQRKARISQCMIVKNEEDVIERALSWGKGIVSEQIVVDTGSTDRTVEIAERMGARVYHFQWVDDFSAAKNYAIDKAQYEWIAFLDADEYFIPEDARKLKYYLEELQDTECESLMTGWVNLDNKGNVIAVGTQRRIFRNSRRLRYEGRIHEALNVNDGGMIETADVVDELSIFHTGYGETENKKKSGRNLKLIQLELEEHPDHYGMWGYLGQEYHSRDQWKEAEEAYRKALALMPEEVKGVYDATASLTALRLIETLITAKKDDSVIMEAYGQAIEGWPEEADYDYVIGRHFAYKGDWENGENYLRLAIERLERYGNTMKAMILSAEIRKAYELLAVCCFNNGHMEECIKYTSLLLREDPYLMSTLMVMLKAFCKGGTVFYREREGALEVAEFLENNFYHFDTLKDRIFVLRAAMAAGYGELIQVMRGMFTQEEMMYVDQALQGRK